MGINRSEEIDGGTLHQEDGTVWVVWDLQGRETWTLPNTTWGIAEATRNFDEMVERWTVKRCQGCGGELDEDWAGYCPTCS